MGKIKNKIQDRREQGRKGKKVIEKIEGTRIEKRRK